MGRGIFSPPPPADKIGQHTKKIEKIRILGGPEIVEPEAAEDTRLGGGSSFSQQFRALKMPGTYFYTRRLFFAGEFLVTLIFAAMKKSKKF